MKPAFFAIYLYIREAIRDIDKKLNEPRSKKTN